jgi:hypothetical protein
MNSQLVHDPVLRGPDVDALKLVLGRDALLSAATKQIGCHFTRSTRRDGYGQAERLARLTAGHS